MLLVLLRAKLPDFHKWVIELLVTQLYDKHRLISSKALRILDEACNDQVNLLTVYHGLPLTSQAEQNRS